MTTAESDALLEEGQKILAREADERFMHTKIVASAAGLRVR